MNQKSKLKPSAITTKIKKWVATAQELKDENFRLAIPITRLTSVKSLCQDERAAEEFAFLLLNGFSKRCRLLNVLKNLPQQNGMPI